MSFDLRSQAIIDESGKIVEFSNAVGEYSMLTLANDLSKIGEDQAYANKLGLSCGDSLFLEGKSIVNDIWERIIFLYDIYSELNSRYVLLAAQDDFDYYCLRIAGAIMGMFLNVHVEGDEGCGYWNKEGVWKIK